MIANEGGRDKGKNEVVGNEYQRAYVKRGTTSVYVDGYENFVCNWKEWRNSREGS